MLCMHTPLIARAGGIPYEFEAVTDESFEADKKAGRYKHGQLPVLEVRVQCYVI